MLSRKTVKYFLPNIKYSVGNIAWKKYGLDIYDLNIIVPGATCDLHRLSLRVNNEKDFQLFIGAYDGLIDYTQVSFEHKKAESEKRSEDIFSFDEIPLKLLFTAKNIDIKTSYGIEGKVDFTFGINPLANTQAYLQATIYDSGVLMINAFQYDDKISLRVKAENIDVAHLFSFDNLYINNDKSNAEIEAEGTWSDKIRKIEKLNVKVNVSADSTKISEKFNAENIYSELNLSLIKPIDFNYQPNDKILYYLNSLNGKFTCNAQNINADGIDIENCFAAANISSGIVNLSEMEMDVFEGKANGIADVSRRKVRGKNKWLFKYNINLCITNINAMEFCDAFSLNKNKLGGRFSGCVKTSVFGKSVKFLDGKLQSDNSGTLYFPEAQKYMTGMQESMQKQIFDMMVDRLKVYPYDSSCISLKYDLRKRTTEINFKFSGLDEYKFSLFYNRSWIDAIKLVGKVM